MCAGSERSRESRSMTMQSKCYSSLKIFEIWTDSAIVGQLVGHFTPRGWFALQCTHSLVVTIHSPYIHTYIHSESTATWMNTVAHTQAQLEKSRYRQCMDVMDEKRTFLCKIVYNLARIVYVWIHLLFVSEQEWYVLTVAVQQWTRHGLLRSKIYWNYIIRKYKLISWIMYRLINFSKHLKTVLFLVRIWIKYLSL